MHYYCFPYHLLAIGRKTGIVQFMEDLTVLTTLNNLGSFVKRYVCLASISNFRKNKDVVHQPKLVRIGKTMSSVSSTKTSGTVFPNTGLPAGE